MRIILMGKDKPVVREGLRYLIAEGHDVQAVIAPKHVASVSSEEQLADVAEALEIPVYSDQELYQHIQDSVFERIDLVVSLLFWKKIKPPLIQLPSIGCLNFHPAPLPDFRGLGGYNVAILDDLKEWGVSAHFVSEHFDTGDLIQVNRFPIQACRETAWSLEQRSQRELLKLFQSVIRQAEQTGSLPRMPQTEGRYIDRREFEALRVVGPEDSPELIERKIRAFWYPPHGGACMKINGVEYTLVSPQILSQVAALLKHDSRPCEPVLSMNEYPHAVLD